MIVAQVADESQSGRQKRFDERKQSPPCGPRATRGSRGCSEWPVR